MKCRKNIRKLIQDYTAASAANKPNTALSKFVNAVVALKSVPSRLPAPHTQANRYDDYVYVHQQSMAGHPNSDPGPHSGHKGPLFFPWHREFLRQFESDLRTASGDAWMCLPYWDFSSDKTPADAGYPFIAACLGGDGTGPNSTVVTGPFIPANGFSVALGGGGEPALQRSLGQDPLAPTLPSRNSIVAALAVNTYDAPPYDRSVAANLSFRNRVEGWVGPDAVNVHNRVHVWVGGSMGPSTSPNDPVFFLNHAKEDELWAVWEQKYPGVPHYLPDDGYAIPPAQHHLRHLSDHMDSLAEYFGAGTIDRPIDLLDHKAITWYDTDLPDITLESGPALAFNNTPAGLTVAKQIRLRVKSCRAVFFSITGAPSGNFSIFGGPDFPVTPLEANDFETLQIEVRFIGQGPNVQVSAVDIQAHIVDEEGYYAGSPGDQFVVRNFHIELVANNIVTSDSSIALVLDRSGSMADVANNGFTKSQLLKSAVAVAHELMKDADQIGIARFDHESDVLLAMTAKSAGLGTTLTGTGLDPRGATNIGGGILVGSGLVNGPGATQPNKALVVLTDGNDYPVPNTIASLPPGTINQTTFAIGFGLPGQVNDATLSQISANTGGYLLTTGNMANDDERFRLAKFFIRILKDATLNQTIMDPEGQLLWTGKPQEIDFLVSDSDVSIDVVALCPIPFALDFQLVTPGGQMITPAMSGVEPNVRYHVGADVAYYRLMLPALPSLAGSSHRGGWKALLGLKLPGAAVTSMKSHLRDNEFIARLREFASKPAPYNLTVHSYSNLMLDATLRQDGFAPGDAVHLTASLAEYRAPLTFRATVWADVVQPDGSRATLPFAPGPAGEYGAQWPTTRPGVYQFLIRAEGRTSGNARFTRAKELTAGVWAGGDRPFDPVGGGSGGTGRDDAHCETMLCLLESAMKSRALRERLKALGLDLNELRRCLESHCGKDHRTTKRQRPTVASSDIWRTLAGTPELARLVGVLASSGLDELKVLEAAKTTPVKRKPKMEGSDENMFLPPEELEKRRAAGEKKK
jgi:hypothetical protein